MFTLRKRLISFTLSGKQVSVHTAVLEDNVNKNVKTEID